MKKIKVREDFEGFGVQKRFDVIVDVLYTDEDFELGGKLNSIVGQYGISDSDKFIDAISHAFNAVLIEVDEEEINQETKYNFIYDGFQNFQDLNTDLSESLDEELDPSSNAKLDLIDDIKNEIDPENLNKFSSLQENFSFIENFDRSENFDTSLTNSDHKLSELNDNYAQYFASQQILDQTEGDNDINIEDCNDDAYQDDDDDKSEDEDDDKSEDEDDDKSEDDDGEENEEEFTFFVPMILIAYRAEKRADFYIYNPFFKRSFLNFFKLNLISYFSTLNNYKDFFFNLKNFYNIKKYMLHVSIFNKYFYNFNFLNSIASYSVVPITRKIFERFYEFDFNSYIFYRSKRRRRRKVFRTYYLKKKKQVASFLRSFKWFPYEIVFKFFMFKYVFFDIKIDYTELKKKILTVYSIMFTFKKKFFRKYRRRKSFKRKVYRNRLGVKMAFIRQQFFEKKKKRKN